MKASVASHQRRYRKLDVYVKLALLFEVSQCVTICFVVNTSLSQVATSGAIAYNQYGDDSSLIEKKAANIEIGACRLRGPFWEKKLVLKLL
jgi:hypothetical protein